MTTTAEKNATATTPPTERVQLDVADDGVALLRLGVPGETMVTLSETRLRSLDEAITELASRPQLRGVIVTGPGPKMFAAGADIKMFESLQDAAAAEQGAATGRQLFGRFGTLRVPVVGAIEGPCLGGGLELALCFDVRVASDDASTRIGLPEVQLGILPGFGGTQRTSRLLGLPKALDVILKARMVSAERAARIGLVDRVVPSPRLLAAARQEIEKLAPRGRKGPVRKLRGLAWWASHLPPLRALVARKVRKTLSTGQARFYNAPKLALECCLDAFRLSPEQGFANEARALGQLITSPTSKALVHVFFLTERSKKLGKGEGARALQRAFVLGGGAMGAGIAGLMASRGLRTRLCDLDGNALAKAKKRLADTVGKRLRRRQIRRHEAQAALDRLAVASEWGSLARTELFLEAVTENLALKQKLFRQAVERGLPDDAVLATNTSSLSVDAMAEGVDHPERLVGLHFFNPPEKMPLVEVVRGRATSDATVATACKLAVSLGKFPLVVRDSPGFLVNRCLGPYMNEAARLMLEGTEPEVLDRVLLDFGMPMGPARLMDEVGFDVLALVSKEAQASDSELAHSPRAIASPLFEAVAATGHLGRKSGGALYGADGKTPGPARAVLQQLRTGSRTPGNQEIFERLVYPMVDEAFRCLDAGIVEDEKDLDLGLVMGIGFPPFTGGVAHYARATGFATIVERLQALARQHGERFAPGDGLRRRAGHA